MKAIACLIKTNLIFAIFALAATANATERIYQSAQGDIDLGILEEKLSDSLNATVEVDGIRWTRDPINYAAYGLEKVRGFASYGAYVIAFTINNRHKATCDLLINERTERVLLSKCRSKTAVIEPKLFYPKISELSNN